MALFRRTNEQDTTPPPAATVPNDPVVPGARKDRPTPSRKEAEALRRQRVTRTLSKKESRAEARRQSRANRIKLMGMRDSAPEKALFRDYIDSRLNLGEFLLPSLVVILALTFVSQAIPEVAAISTITMYLFIILVILDGVRIWRGFQKVLAVRLPNAPKRGLMMYGMNRSIQIRRFRIPPPRIKRGEAY